MHHNSVSRMRQWRRHLHSQPETGFDEHQTSGLIAELLTSFGLTPHRGIGGTGVVASLVLVLAEAWWGCAPTWTGWRWPSATRCRTRRGTTARCTPAATTGTWPWCSAPAAVLAEQGGFDGTVRLVFQPAEEPGGARRR